jgi:hypothetical protein
VGLFGEKTDASERLSAINTPQASWTRLDKVLAADPIQAIQSAVERVYAGELEPVIYPEATFVTLPVRNGRLASGAVMAFDVSRIRHYHGRSRFEGCRAIRWSESLRAAVVVYGTETATGSGRWTKSKKSVGIGVLGLVGVDPIDAFVAMTVLDPPVLATTQCEAFRAILASPKQALVSQLERPLGAGSTRSHRDVPAIANFLLRASHDAQPWTSWDVSGWSPDDEITDTPIARPTEVALIASGMPAPEGSAATDRTPGSIDHDSRPGRPSSGADAPLSGSELVDQIERLVALKDSGYIDDEEFVRLKAKLLE